MYFGHEQTIQWCRAVADIAATHPAVRDDHVTLVVLPSFLYIAEAVDVFAGTRVAVGGQDLFWADEGAFTGEVSGKHLRELGCGYAEIGHAERRRVFGETDTMIAAKTAAAFRNRLTPILCVGEAVRSNPAGAATTLPGAVGCSALGGSGRGTAGRRLRTALGDRRRETGVPGVCGENLCGDSRSPRRAAGLRRKPSHLRWQRGTRPAYPAQRQRRRAFPRALCPRPVRARTHTHRSARRQRNDTDRRSASQRGEVTMAIGLSTYAFFWRISERVEHPLTLHQMLEHTHDSGCSVLQICDYAPLETLSPAELAAVDETAKELGIRLELGTRGITPEHLRRYLDFADQLDVTLVRSMVNTADHKPTEAEAIDLLAQTAPEYAERGVTLALETYEQVPSAQLVRIVEAIGSENLGICLDPANCVAGLELPTDVVSRTAPYVKNWHVKDFAFTRQAGWVGFTLTGCPLGEGLLDYDSVVHTVQPAANNINQIVEHWLPWQDDAATTCALETQWTQHNVNYLRSKS